MIGYYVPRNIGEAFEADPLFAGLVGRGLSILTTPVKNIFVTYNPGWAMMNVERDIKAWAKQMPGGSIPKALKYAIKAIPHAYKDVVKGKSTDVVQRLYRGKALIYGRGYGKHLVDTFDDLDKLAINVTSGEDIYKRRVWKPIAKFLGFLNKFGEMSERITKIGGAMYLDEKFPDMNEKLKMHYVRKRAGSPDFQAGGINKQISNNMFLFSNVAEQGISAARESWAEDPKGYWWKTAKYDIIPKLLMVGVSMGLAGYYLKRLMDKVSEYDKRNYIVIPLYEQDNGKVVYIKMPHGFQGQIVGGLTWIAGRILQQQVSDEPIATPGISAITDYTAGQMPYSGFNPMLQLIMDTVQYASGKNPYNAYYGEKAIPDQLFEAGG